MIPVSLRRINAFPELMTEETFSRHDSSELEADRRDRRLRCCGWAFSRHDSSELEAEEAQFSPAFQVMTCSRHDSSELEADLQRFLGVGADVALQSS